MCCVHRQHCKCFSVYESGNGEFHVVFADGSFIAGFCEQRTAKVVAWLLNRSTAMDTLLCYVCEILRRVRLIEDCEHERFVWKLAVRLSKNDNDMAKKAVRDTALELQEERNYV
jgi:hypothetical protein